MPSSPGADRGIRWLLVALLPIYFLAALWPFRWERPELRGNGAHPEGAAIVFGPAGRLVGSAAELLAEARLAHSMTIFLRVRPARAIQVGPARILEIGVDHERGNLTVGQDGDDLIARLRRAGSDPSGTPELRIPHAFRDGPDRSLAITLEVQVGRARLTVDEHTVVELDFDGDPFATWDDDATLILGDSPIGEREWLGRIEVASGSFHDEVFDLLGDRLVDRPEAWIWWPPRLRVLFASNFVPPVVPEELLLNLLGFLPLGFLGALGFRRSPRRAAFAIGLAVSLGMESSQFLFAERIPALPDLVANSIGAWLGGLVAAWTLRSHRSCRSSIRAE